MSERRLKLMDIREMLRHIREERSDRQIGKDLGVDRRTVKRYRIWAQGQGLLTGELPDHESLLKILDASMPEKMPPQNSSKADAYRVQIETLLKEKVKVTAIFDRLREQGYPGSYASVLRLARQIMPKPVEVFTRKECQPGEEAEIDFGYVGMMLDAEGNMRKAWAFVMVLGWSRYAYGYNNPSRFTDPSGHSVCDMGEYADPECGNMNNQYQTILADKTKNNEIPKPIDHRLEEIDDDLPFDATLGENNETSGSEMLLQNERPSLAALIVMGIPLTIAIILSEGVLVLAEVILVDATIAAPELALATVPLGLVLAGSGVALVDIEVAYWLYTYRVAVTPENEPVKFEILPPWGFGD